MQASTNPLQSTAAGPVAVPAVPSPLSLIAPDLAIRTARFYLLAGLTPADLNLFPGYDLAFKAEVAGAMADLLAGGAR